jgi:hypothetical protein
MELIETAIPPDVVRFVDERIESVPHLEALLLLWENAHLRWDVELTAARLYVDPGSAASILEDLANRGLVNRYSYEGHVHYGYDNGWDSQDGGTMARVAATYRQQLLQVTTLIHSKAPAAVREFARAFRIPMKKKE